MKKPFLFGLTILLVYSLRAQEQEIGIYEKLDQFVAKDIVLQDENGKDVRLGELVDKPTVLTLVYFTCPGICSPLLDGVAEVISRCDLKLGKDYQVLSVSFNSSEKSDLAKAKRKNYVKQVTKPVPDDGWRFFTADSSNIARLTDGVGFKYKKQGRDFIHAATLIVLSPAGKITRYLYGTTYLPFDLKMAIIESAKGKSSPTINKVLQYCFSFDPQGKKYVFNIMKVSATIILSLIAIFFLYLVFSKKKNVNN
ncbi:MAG: SCO family protein [Bacteroidia bacterium]|nr:SCO family protein [Bacteroidia bacterium]